MTQKVPTTTMILRFDIYSGRAGFVYVSGRYTFEWRESSQTT